MIFPNFLRSQVFSRSATREAPRIYHVHYNQASLQLLLNEKLLNHQNVSKYYEHDCGSCWTGDILVSFATHLGPFRGVFKTQLNIMMDFFFRK